MTTRGRSPIEDVRLPFRSELRQKWPGLAKRVDKGHPLAAIRLACGECSGSLTEVEGCPDTNCFLWPLRLGRRPQRRADQKGKIQRNGARLCSPLPVDTDGAP